MKNEYRPRFGALSLVTGIVMALSALAGCAEKPQQGADSESSTDIIRTDTVTTSKQPEVSATSLTADSAPSETEKQTVPEQDDDIYKLVCGSVANKLSEAGFDTRCGYCVPSEPGGNIMRGLCFTDDRIKLFGGDDINTGGFVEVISAELAGSSAAAAEEPVTITVSSGDDGNDGSEGDGYKQYLCAYNYDNIGSSHFVYKDKYVKYRQTSSSRIEYTEMENTVDNYDLDLGSLYDYDNNRYLYDEMIFTGAYETHNGVGLFEEVDYEELNNSLKAMAEQQEKNGYSVETCSVVYISPENVQAIIDGKTEDKLFGYSIEELEKAFGEGTELVFKDGVPSAVSRGNSAAAGVISGNGIGKRFAAGGIIIVSIGIMAHNGVSVTKSFISILKNRKFLMSELKNLINNLTEFAAECSRNISNGMSVSDSLVSAVTKQSGEVFDDMLISTAIVTSSIALNSVKTGLGDKVIDYNMVIRTAWENIDDISEKAGRLSWDMISGVIHGEISLEELSGYVVPNLGEQLDENGIVVYNSDDAVEIENNEGTVVELVPSVADMVFK